MLNFYRLQQDYLKFTGTERLDLINRLSTNEVKSLEKFQTVKTVLTSDKGRFVDLLTMYNLGDLVFASCSFNNSAIVIAHLDKYTIMDDFTPLNMSGTHETILFYGDKVNEFVNKISGKDIQGLKDNEFIVTTEHDAIIAKNDDAFGGVLFIYSVNDKTYWDELLFSNENINELSMHEVTPVEYDVKRVELGIPLYGKEMSELTNPLECGMNKYVSFTKGCYIGQEVIARLDAYDKISKHMVGFRLQDKIDNLPGENCKITVDGKECGFTTSMVSSVAHGTIGIGFVKTIFLDFEKKYKIKYNERELECTLQKLPFTT